MKPGRYSEHQTAPVYWLIFFTLIGLIAASWTVEAEDEFEKYMRPVFLTQCSKCHGENNPDGDLRLDNHHGFTLNTIRQIADMRQFLRNSIEGKANGENPVSEHVQSLDFIQVLGRWIDNGAEWPSENSGPGKPDEEGHDSLWAWKPISRPTPPETSNPDWNRNPIDQLIFRKLNENNIHPSPVASPKALIRRLYVNLTGIHPEWDTVKELLSDWNPETYYELIERLLSSPAYGERWARHWLDVARYADAKGYVDAGEVKYPFAFTYRDYVIDSFNNDLPFNTFIRQQIAADQYLTKENSSETKSLAALGFLTTGHRFNFFNDEILDDRIDVVTRGFLGLTVACARCHDHKYDPVTTENYYSLFGIFRNSYEPTPDSLPPLYPSDANENDQLEGISKAAEKYNETRKGLHRKIVDEMTRFGGDYLEYIVQSSPRHRTYPQPKVRTERGLIRVKAAYSAGGVIRWQQFLEKTPDDHPIFGLWSQAWKMPPESIAHEFPAILKKWQMSSSANQAILDQLDSRDGRVTDMADLADVYGTVFQKSFESEMRGANDGLSRIYTFLTGPASPGYISIDESEDLYTLDESTQVRGLFAQIEREFLKVQHEIAPRPMALADRPANEMIRQVVYHRGDRFNMGAAVPREIPGILRGGTDLPVNSGSGRKELAESIASDNNPLTARVIVNRVWAWHFGNGLVSTPSDFGTRSSTPTHPDLLDYLSGWFIDNGWSIKKLNRLIVQSRTWQQSSGFRDGPDRVDPDNRFLWRMNSPRLDFESMRDSILSTSGCLDHSIGGQPVMKSPDDSENVRRTIYTYIDRENLSDTMRAFDFPSPDISAAERQTTTVPQQSLFLINSPFMIQMSRKTAAIAIENFPNSPRQLFGWLFNKIYLRNATESEIFNCLEYIDMKAASDNQLTEESVSQIIQAMFISNEFQFLE